MIQVTSEQDFIEVRKQLSLWHQRFPMFRHDVAHIEKIIEEHIKQYSIAMVHYRQSHKKNYLEQAKKEIENINSVLSLVSKMELMSMLSQN